MTEQPMTAADAARAFEALRGEIGEAADLHVGLGITSRFGVRERAALWVRMYPRGFAGKWTIEATGDTFDELLTNAREAWIEARAENEDHLIRDMALQIIRITADLGECTDAALRQHFEARDVDQLGARACAEANDIAGRGPFAIVETSGANAAAA